MKARIMMSMLVIALAAALVGGATMAWFTDQADIGGNEFKAGRLTIDVADRNKNTTFNLGEIGKMEPGDITDEATIRIRNTGNIDAATFGRFQTSGGSGLAHALKFYKYEVNFFDKDNEALDRKDVFIKDGEIQGNIGGMHTNLRKWIDNSGPCDIMGTAWDMEALKPWEYFEITFSLQLDPQAGNEYQEKTTTLLYEVLATQVQADAIVDLNLAGVEENTIRAPKWGVYDYLAKQVDRP